MTHEAFSIFHAIIDTADDDEEDRVALVIEEACKTNKGAISG